MKVAVVGATGAVGQTTLRILEERKFPVSDLRLFASARSAGSTVGFKGDRVKVQALGPGAFAGVDIALFSAGSAQSKEYAPQAVKAGAVVVDKSSAFRMDPDVPLVVPEVNGRRRPAAPGHRGLPELHDHRHRDAAQAAARRRRPPSRDRHQLPGRLGSGRQRRGGAAPPGAPVGARRGAHHPALPPPDRVQRHPAHRSLRRRRLHRRGVEARARGAKDPGAARPRRSRRPPSASPCSPRTPSPSTRRRSGASASSARARRSRSFRACGSGTSPPRAAIRCRRSSRGRTTASSAGSGQTCRCRTGSTSGSSGDQLRKGAALNGIQIAELLIR